MAGEDLTSAQLAAPARPPLPMPTRETLIELGRRVVDNTWRHGLPSWFWGEGVCLIGQLLLARASGEPVPAAVLDWLDAQVKDEPVIEHVNNLAPGTALLLADPERPAYRATADRLLDWARTSPQASRDTGGALEHWPGGVWADTAYMAGLFLGHYGAVTGDADLLDELGRQVLAHARVLQHPGTGLYAHGSHRGETIPSYWGRGNAWCALAAVDYLELAAATGLAADAVVADVRDVLRRQLGGLVAHQPAHGVWSVLVDDQSENAGILETSAAAGLGAALLRAARLLPSEPGLAEAGWRAVRGALAYVDADGMLTRVSAGTVLQLIPFGYSVIRDDRWQPWGQGLALHAVAAALDALEES